MFAFRKIHGNIVPLRKSDGSRTRRNLAVGATIAAGLGVAAAVALRKKPVVMPPAAGAKALAALAQPKGDKSTSAYHFIRKHGGYFFGPKGTARKFRGSV